MCFQNLYIITAIIKKTSIINPILEYFHLLLNHMALILNIILVHQNYLLKLQ